MPSPTSKPVTHRRGDGGVIVAVGGVKGGLKDGAGMNGVCADDRVGGKRSSGDGTRKTSTIARARVTSIDTTSHGTVKTPPEASNNAAASSSNENNTADGWQCHRCDNMNTETKSRCSECQGWKGGKRENTSLFYSSASSTKARGKRAKATSKSVAKKSISSGNPFSALKPAARKSNPSKKTGAKKTNAPATPAKAAASEKSPANKYTASKPAIAASAKSPSNSSKTDTIQPWECTRCNHRNTFTKTRCKACQGWRGGKRDNITAGNKRRRSLESLDCTVALSTTSPLSTALSEAEEKRAAKRSRRSLEGKKSAAKISNGASGDGNGSTTSKKMLTRGNAGASRGGAKHIRSSTSAAQSQKPHPETSTATATMSKATINTAAAAAMNHTLVKCSRRSSGGKKSAAKMSNGSSGDDNGAAKNMSTRGNTNASTGADTRSSTSVIVQSQKPRPETTSATAITSTAGAAAINHTQSALTKRTSPRQLRPTEKMAAMQLERDQKMERKLSSRAARGGGRGGGTKTDGGVAASKQKEAVPSRKQIEGPASSNTVLRFSRSCKRRCKDRAACQRTRNDKCDMNRLVKSQCNLFALMKHKEQQQYVRWCNVKGIRYQQLYPEDTELQHRKPSGLYYFPLSLKEQIMNNNLVCLRCLRINLQLGEQKTWMELLSPHKQLEDVILDEGAEKISSLHDLLNSDQSARTQPTTTTAAALLQLRDSGRP